jgi:hypothetical protein
MGDAGNVSLCAVRQGWNGRRDATVTLEIACIHSEAGGMKRFVRFFVTHGYVWMGIGMVLALAGVFFLMNPRHRLGLERTVSLAVGITGFVLYFVGRVCVVLERRLPPSSRNNEPMNGQS